MKACSKDWFRGKFVTQGSDDPSAYYGHARNGYQLFRHEQLITVLMTAVGGLSGRMLDLGCGTGELTSKLAMEFRLEDAVGTDFVPEIIDYAKTIHPELCFRVDSLPKIGCPSASFDLVVASEVLYYLDRGMRRDAMIEICRLLRPGGILLFSSALGDGYFQRDTVRAYVETRLEILSVSWQYNSLYHWLTRPLQQAHSLRHVLCSGSQVSRKSVQARLDRLKWLLRRPGFLALLKCVCRIGGAVERSRALPGLMNWVCRWLPLLGPSNVTIVARKPLAAD